jgi:hypothetical protein
MKATELIQKLQEMVEEHGDLNVDYLDYVDGRVQDMEIVIDENGFSIQQ